MVMFNQILIRSTYCSLQIQKFLKPQEDISAGLWIRIRIIFPSGSGSLQISLRRHSSLQSFFVAQSLCHFSTKVSHSWLVFPLELRDLFCVKISFPLIDDQGVHFTDF